MTEKQNLVVKLSEGYSIQSKTANKFWLVLLISSVIAITGRIEHNLIELPFTLGNVNPADFYAISVVLVSVLIIASNSAMIQTNRTRQLIQKVIKKFSETEMYIENIHVLDYFDSTVTPTYIRVAPISQFLLGKKQFYGDGKANLFRRIIVFILYITLKLSTFAFIYFIPLFAIFTSWSHKINTVDKGTLHIPNWTLLLTMIIALITMAILFISDLKYTYNVIKRISA